MLDRLASKDSQYRCVTYSWCSWHYAVTLMNHAWQYHSNSMIKTAHSYCVSKVSVQPCHNTRSLSMVTLARPPTRSSLKITNRSFQYAAPCLWNRLPTDLRKPRQTQSPSLSPITDGSSSSSSSPSSWLLLASSITRLDLQIIFSIDLFVSYQTESTDSRTI